MKVIARYCGYYAGTSETIALGHYDSLEDAEECALDWAFGVHQSFAQTDEDCEEESYYMQSLDYVVEEYNPEKHDMLRSGGGSFEDDFERLK